MSAPAFAAETVPPQQQQQQQQQQQEPSSLAGPASAPVFGAKKCKRAQKAFSGADQQRWQQRVREIHAQQLSDGDKARLQALRQKAEVTRDLHKKRKCAKQLQMRSHAMQQCYWGGVKSCKSMSAAPEQSDAAEYDAVVANTTEQMAIAEQELSDADEVELAPDQVSHDEMSELLNAMKVEPSDDTECTATFKLYENYQEKVAVIRKDMFEFWHSNETTFPDAVATSFRGRVTGVDKAENMGVDFDAQEWFVYHMLRKVDRNIKLMETIMKDMENKLELLANLQQDECPICLEHFTEECAPEVLGCCHQVCQDCWDHWKQLMGMRAFCPLCKHLEFVDAVGTEV